MLIIFSCKPESTKPNIVFAILDDASYNHFGAYGCDWVKTPNFDKIAGEGILFTNAYTPNAKCGPSRSTILTGKNSWQLEEAVNHWCAFPEKFKTYTEVLSENGYEVGYTGKGWAPGDPGQISGKPRLLTGHAYNEKKMKPPTTGISNIDYASNFNNFLNSREVGMPFCFWVGSKEPHRKYEFGSGIATGNKKLSDVSESYSLWPQNDSVYTDLLDYALEIEYFDNQLGEIISILEEKGMLNNTLVIVTSDNGMPFPRIKGQAYELSNHMPLVMMWPDGISGNGRRIDDFVSFIDFAPTFLEIAGVSKDKSGMQTVEGKSLMGIFNSTRSGKIEARRDHVLIGKERHDIGRPDDVGYPIRGIVKDGYLLVQNFKNERWPAGNPETGYLNCDGGPTKTVCLDTRADPATFKYWDISFGKRPQYELFNIKEDMFCLKNLADEASYQTILAKLIHQMHHELSKQEDPRIAGNGQIFDNYPYANPDGHNFYKRYMDGEEMNTAWVNESDFRDLD